MGDRTEYQRRYREEHRTELAAYHKQYQADRRDELAEYHRQYYAEHCEEIKERSRQRHGDNREECCERSRQYYYNKGGQAMSDNRSCTLFLGVYVAEELLSHLFKNVIRMPHKNPGFDFTCGEGYLIDVKSSCARMGSTEAGSIRWMFMIKRNPIADYFLCIAFDNRRDLNPLHYWLIPGNVLSHLVTASISESTLDKWAEYEKPIDTATACCDTIKEAI